MDTRHDIPNISGSEVFDEEETARRYHIDKVAAQMRKGGDITITVPREVIRYAMIALEIGGHTDKAAALHKAQIAAEVQK